MTYSANDEPDPFWQIMGQAGEIYAPPEEWPTVPCDGVRVRVDQDAGRAFREGVLGAYAAAKAARPVDGRAAILNEVYDFFHDESCQIPVGSEVMVNGKGVFLAYEDANSTVARMNVVYNHNVFGKLIEPVFGNLYNAELDSIVQYAESSDPDARLDCWQHEGLGLLLSDITVCETTGYGPIRMQAPQAVVSVHVPTLAIHKAIREQ